MIVCFILIILAGRAGFSLWQTHEQHVGYFNVSSNSYGVAIYQETRRASVQFANTHAFTIHNNEITLFPRSNTPILLTYNRDDIVIDDYSTLYTEPTQEQLTVLTQTLHTPLVKAPSSPRTIALTHARVYIVNPAIPGVLEVKIPDGLQAHINRNEKQITFNAPHSLTITVYDTLPL